uniref:Caspase-7 n=2 Tax=Magallana gigas TaxID=29159 RepID=A0A8W8L4Y0_MAGGI|nr:caspase-7 [Crassostrea gigas]
MEEAMNQECVSNTDVPEAKPVSGTYASQFEKSKAQSDIPVATSKQTSTEFFSHKYKMDYPNRGKAIIINNKTFNAGTGLNVREGMDQDASALYNCLSKLKFDVDLKHNRTADEIKATLQKAAKLDHRDNDCFICAILSHGGDGYIWGTDRMIPINDLIEPFKGNECLSLAGKPKIFFIQACHDDMNVGDGKEVEPQFSRLKIPSEADFLIACSVVPGYYSWRNERNKAKCPSFVQALSDVLEKHGQKMDLLTMMTHVNQIVGKKFQPDTSHPDMNEKKQIPLVTSMLTKEVYFTIK